MHKYELTVVFHPALGDDEVSAEFAKVKEVLERFSGVVEKVDEWGRRRLAYEIKKVNEGVYFLVTFDGENKVPGEVESRLRINEKVIRYLIVRVDE
jgi:small subunit ribosomal protein S6